jgi:hypothetical protein
MQNTLSHYLKNEQVEDAPCLSRPPNFPGALAVDAGLGHDGEGLVGELVEREVDEDGAEDDDEGEDVQLEEEGVAHFLA